MGATSRALAKNLGAKAFRMQKAGANFPPEVMRAARLAASGQASEGDLQTLRNAMGIHRTGATGARKFAQQLGRAASQIQRVQALSGLLSSDTDGARASLALANTIVQETSNLVNNKFAKKVIEGVATKFTKDPKTAAAFGYAVRGGLRLGAAIGGAVVSGFQAAEALMAGSGARWASESRMKTASREFGGDPSKARRLQENIMRAKKRQSFFGTDQGFIGGITANTGDAGSVLADFLDSRPAAEAEAEQREEFGVRAKMRNSLRDFGHDPNALLNSRGMPAEFLSESEMQEALDAPIDTLMQGYTNNAAAQQYAESEYAKMTHLQKGALAAAGGTEAKMIELKRKAARKQAEAVMEKQHDRLRAADQALKAMTPAQRYKKWEAEQIATRNHAAYRSRHQVVEYD